MDYFRSWRDSAGALARNPVKRTLHWSAGHDGELFSDGRFQDKPDQVAEFVVL